MARTIVGVNDPKAVKRYSGNLAVDTSAKSYWSQRFMARGAEAEVPVQILTELESDAGEEIKYDLLAELTMAPVEGDDTLEGKEEKQRFYTDSVYIDQARCGVNTGGRMTRKRTLHNLREKAKRQQSSWWARFHDEMLFMYGAGMRGVNANFLVGTAYAGRANNAFVTPDSSHHVYGGDATDVSNIDANDKQDLVSIEAALTRAAVQGGGASGIPVMQPCKIDGDEVFIYVMHTWQEDDLRKATGTAGWLDLQKAAAAFAGPKSPLFNKALGMHRGVILHSHKNVIRFGAGASGEIPAARGLFMGAQAMVCAYGSPGTNMRFDWNEESRDNANQVVITSASILGCKKVTYTTEQAGAQDFGVFAVSTACAVR